MFKKISILFTMFFACFICFTMHIYASEDKLFAVSISSDYTEKYIYYSDLPSSQTSFTSSYNPTENSSEIHNNETNNTDLIFGTDDRIILSDYQYTQYPYRTVCSIYVEFEDGEDNPTTYGYVGTGCLVGPHTVLSCSHLFYNNEYGWATYIEVQIGAHIDSITNVFTTSYTTSSWVNLMIGVQYITNSADDDWAILDLSENLGNQYGYFGLSSSLSVNDTVTLYAYHGDLNGNMAYGLGQVTALNTYNFRHNCDAVAGSSGGPLTSGSNTIVGIHSRGYSSTEDQACKISSYIVSWIEERL